MSISNAAELTVAREETDGGLDQLRIGLVGVDDIQAPSRLPDWDQGHLFAHTANVADAFTRQIEYALRGEQVAMYDGGMAGRDAAIAELAGKGKTELLEAFGAASTRLHDALALITEDDLRKPSSFRGGSDVSEIVRGARRETLIHLVDADVGYTSAMWSLDFVRDLVEFLAARVPENAKLVLQPLAMDPKVLTNPKSGSGAAASGAGEPAPTNFVISGMLNDIAAWLAGREPEAQVQAHVGTEPVDLPELLPWPSGMTK